MGVTISTSICFRVMRTFVRENFRAGAGVSKVDAKRFNSLRKIAFDAKIPSNLRENAVQDILKIDSKGLPKYKKLHFMNMLLSKSQKNESLSNFLRENIADLAPDKPKVNEKVSPKSPEEEFMAKTLNHLKRNSSKAGQWGSKLPESDFVKIQKLVKLSDHGFYVHRDLISDHLLIPFTEDRKTRSRSINLTDVTSWKVQNKPILQSYCSETEEIIEARQRYRVISNRLNIEDRYLLKDLTFDIATTRGDLTLRYDFVGLNKTDLGLRGSWVISIFGMTPEIIQTFLDFEWMTLRTFLKKSKISSRGVSTKMLDTTVLIEAPSDDEAHKEVGFLLEELLFFILGAKITGFKMNEKRLTPAQRSKRSAQIESLQKRTKWIVKNPRGPYKNNCVVCGRGLSVSISVDRSIGPCCWAKLFKEKSIKKIDLRPGYDPLRYEATITKEELLDYLVATYSIRG